MEGVLAFQRRKPDDNIYGWFEVMRRLCAGKPPVYSSRYRPGPRLFAIARALHVKMVWSPLQKVPQEFVERHRTFRQLPLAESQSEALTERLAAARTRQPPGFERLPGLVDRAPARERSRHAAYVPE